MGLLDKIRNAKAEQPLKLVPEKSLEISDEEFQELAGEAPIEAAPAREPVAQAKAPISGLENNPRQTVISLFKLPADTPFTFKTKLHQGQNYLDAMRQLISRARRHARIAKQPITHWKMLLMGPIEHHATYDLLTLVKTQMATIRQKEMYADLLDVMAGEDGEEKG